MTRHIADAIQRITKKGVSVRYLLPKFPDRLQVGLQYMKSGAEIFFSSCLMVPNLRYIIVDDEIIVLGIPGETGEKEPPPLKANMVIAVGNCGLYTGPWGVRVEDTVLVGPDGPKVLTGYPRQLKK